MSEIQTTRRNDIDWLRIFAVGMLFIFHTGKVFDVQPYYPLKNGELSRLLDTFTGFIHIWHMPLFFTLAGWSAAVSFSKRGQGAFLRERVRRILVPFLIGIVTICPPIRFVHFQTAKGFTGSFMEFIPLFFTRLDYFSWSHLWFLIYLFTFTLIYLPLFKRLDSASFRTIRSNRLALYSPIALLVVIQLVLRPIFPGWQNLVWDWANFTYYSTFFICGYMFGRYPDLENRLHAERKMMRWLALAALLGLLACDILQTWGAHTLSLFAVASYACVATLLGYGNAWLETVERHRPYFAEAAYPVYWLHQPAIVLIGWWVTAQALPIAIKLPILMLLATVATLLVYHVIVRRVSILRLALGMRLTKT